MSTKKKEVVSRLCMGPGCKGPNGEGTLKLLSEFRLRFDIRRGVHNYVSVCRACEKVSQATRREEFKERKKQRRIAGEEAAARTPPRTSIACRKF